MSNWTHNICAECWNLRSPDRTPVRLANPDPVDDSDYCCFCLKLNMDGIYVREDPDTLPCKGLHPNYR